VKVENRPIAYHAHISIKKRNSQHANDRKYANKPICQPSRPQQSSVNHVRPACGSNNKDALEALDSVEGCQKLVYDPVARKHAHNHTMRKPRVRKHEPRIHVPKYCGASTLIGIFRTCLSRPYCRSLCAARHCRTHQRRLGMVLRPMLSQTRLSRLALMHQYTCLRSLAL
jgi:hypothetical protein